MSSSISPPPCRLTVGVIGAGKMGQMLLRAFKQSINNISILASTSDMAHSLSLGNNPEFFEIQFSQNEEIFAKSDVIFLCVRPHQIFNISDSSFSGTLVSICSGVSFTQLENQFPRCEAVIRCMPSYTCNSSKPSSGLYMLTSKNPIASADAIETLLKSSGVIFWVKSEEFDAATAIGASAPAFVSIFLEGLADGAVSCGLSRQLAYAIGAQMAAGTAQLVMEGNHPSEIKDKVSTSGGCTIEGLIHLESNNIRGAAAKAIQATVAKIATLSGKK